MKQRVQPLRTNSIAVMMQLLHHGEPKDWLVSSIHQHMYPDGDKSEAGGSKSAWFAPISITMVAVVVMQYGRELKNHRQLRTAVLSFAMASFVAAGVAGFFGAMLNKQAPVPGGHTIQLSKGGSE